MNKYEKMIDEIKQIVTDPMPSYDGSVARYMGYRPSEERIKEVLTEIIEKYEVVKIELNVNRDWISYWYRSSTPKVNKSG